MELKKLINEILSKTLQPTKIYKGLLLNDFTIEVETKNPIAFTTLVYKNEVTRDTDFLKLDNEVFDTLTFNPYKVT